MLVPGAIAATSAAIAMMNPAEAARAPDGPTNTATGVRQLSILSTIWRIELSRPPGVSIRITTSGARCASARSIAWTTWAALTAWTTPSSSTTGISERAPVAGTRSSARAAAVLPSHLSDIPQL
jgi:hypothetical protein